MQLAVGAEAGTATNWSWLLKHDQKFSVVYIFVPLPPPLLLLDPEGQKERLRADIAKVASVFDGLCIGGSSPVIWAKPMVQRTNRLLVGLFRVDDLPDPDGVGSQLFSFQQITPEAVEAVPEYLSKRFADVPEPLVQRALELQRTLRSLASEEVKQAFIDTTNLLEQAAVYQEAAQTLTIKDKGTPSRAKVKAKTTVKYRAQRKGKGLSLLGR